MVWLPAILGTRGRQQIRSPDRRRMAAARQHCPYQTDYAEVDFP